MHAGGVIRTPRNPHVEGRDLGGIRGHENLENILYLMYVSIPDSNYQKVLERVLWLEKKGAKKLFMLSSIKILWESTR